MIIKKKITLIPGRAKAPTCTNTTKGYIYKPPTAKKVEAPTLFTRQKIDSLVSVVKISSAFIPITELPLLLSRGLHTATA